MNRNLLNAEFASVVHRNAGDKNLHVSQVMKALTKVSRHAGKLLLHICLLSIAFLGIKKVHAADSEERTDTPSWQCLEIFAHYV